MPVTEETYRRVALEDPEGQWELHCGRLRQRPGMTLEHNQVQTRLLFDLMRQLDAQGVRWAGLDERGGITT